MKIKQGLVDVLINLELVFLEDFDSTGYMDWETK